MKAQDFPVGATVFDSWWPWRVGRVVRQMKTRVRVCWSNGEEWTYDQAHLQFLRCLRRAA